MRIPTPNYKKGNWRKSQKHLNEMHQEKHGIPKDRNLTKEEIDSHIMMLEKLINKAIDEVIPLNKYLG